MSIFAKLFEGQRGQILVKLDSNDEGCPEIRYYVQPEGLGVTAVAYGYEDSDKGWDDAENAFEKIGLEYAEKVVQQIFDIVGEL